MTCEICGRSSCIKSFHSLESQERFDKKREMSDDVDSLREEILSLQEENTELLKKIEKLELIIDMAAT